MRSAAIAVFALGLVWPTSLLATPEVGKVAPGFMLRDRAGTLVSLDKLAYAGKERPHLPKRVVVLDFFSTSCKPCRESLPQLMKLHRHFQGREVEIILIALLEQDEGEQKLDQFLKPLPFKVLVDPYQAAGKKYVVTDGKIEIPSLFIVDRDGTLRARHKGLPAAALPQITQQIEGLLP